LKSCFFIIAFTAIGLSLSAQIIQRQTTASAGSSAQILYGNQKIFIQSSIGQASVIGSSAVSGAQLRQGFIQPLGTKYVRSSSQSQLDVNVFPNPFRNSFSIEFFEVLRANVSVLDVMGREVFQTRFENLKTARIELNDISPGTYILLIQSKNKMFKGQIIKY